VVLARNVVRRTRLTALVLLLGAISISMNMLARSTADIDRATNQVREASRKLA